MSETNYLDDSEPILYEWKIRDSEIETSKNVLGVTKRRIFHFKRYKRDWTYRDIPLRKINRIENGWHGKSIPLLILGSIGILGVIFLLFMSYNPYLNFYSPGSSMFFFIGAVILFFISIYVIFKGAKEYGYILINNSKWKFDFNKSLEISKIQKMIRVVYSLIEE
jgi:hypothetical protein